jgi:hypothetical protein
MQHTSQTYGSWFGPSGLAMLDGSVYAVGGWEGSFRLDSVERYDPDTNSWHIIAPMKMAVTSPAVVAHDGMLYVTGMKCLVFLN